MRIRDKAKNPLTDEEIGEACKHLKLVGPGRKGLLPHKYEMARENAIATAAFWVGVEAVIAILRERGAHEQADYIKAAVTAAKDGA